MTTEQLDKYSDKIFRFLIGRTGDKELAKDLTQDILLKIMKKRSQLSSIGNLDAWIYRVARNRLIDHARKKSESRIHEYEQIEGGSEEQDFLDGINSCLKNIIKDHEGEETELYLKVFSGELTQKDAAKQLNIAYSTFKSRVQKVRKDVFNRFLDECCELIYNSKREVINCRPLCEDESGC
jgi:RNA polymerase sigma-70 factor, ECF subfamily